MKLFFKYLLTGILLFSILACTSSVTQHGTSDQIIGILNEFPATPKYIKGKTFVFRHEVAGYKTDGFKNILTQSAGEYLVSKGYKVIEVESITALKDGSADMIVQIQPMDIFKQDGTAGYGFYDRKILGL